MKKILFLVPTIITYLTLTLCGCEDNQPPRVVITFPSEGAHIGGEITITADAHDNVGVKYVRFSISVPGYSYLQEVDVTEPYEYQHFVTTIYPNGTNVTILAGALDFNANWDEDTVNVTVHNTFGINNRLVK